MILPVPVSLLEACPDCSSKDFLVVVLYGLPKDPLGGKPTLECESCCAVVTELTLSQVRAMRKTVTGRKIINRESVL